MNHHKSELYVLSPAEYLTMFKNPHSVISKEGSVEQDERDTKILENFLKEFYDDSPETEGAKLEIVKDLSKVVENWMEAVAKAVGKDGSNFKNLGYGPQVFGSYKVGTSSFDGDIDMICLVPEYFEREKHFFGVLAGELRRDKTVTHFYCIPDALVPLLRLKTRGIQVDLLMGRVDSRDLVERLKNPNINWCNGDMPEQELRIINGYRTALYFREYMDKHPNFRVALRALKMWAKNKGIYSQVYGYLGGAAYSVLLAKICQLYPNYSPLQLLDRFFLIYSNWYWGLPVCIEKIDSEINCRYDMVIRTPLSPQMNAAHYVSRATFKIIINKLREAADLIKEINAGKKGWLQLFMPTRIFKEYKELLEISMLADRLEELMPWQGHVESKMRKLIKFIEQIPDFIPMVEVNPFPHQFKSQHPGYALCYKYYIGFKCLESSSMDDFCEVDLTQIIRSFLEVLESYPNIHKAPKDINIMVTFISRENIPAAILEEFSYPLRCNTPSTSEVVEQRPKEEEKASDDK